MSLIYSSQKNGPSKKKKKTLSHQDQHLIQDTKLKLKANKSAATLTTSSIYVTPKQFCIKAKNDSTSIYSQP